MRDKYFAELSDSHPPEFTLSKLVMELSLPQGTEKSAGDASQSTQSDGSRRLSLRARVRGLVDVIKGHLGEPITLGDRSTDLESGSRGDVEPLIKLG